MILLDTNVVVAFLNGDKSILKRIRVEIDEIGLSTLVVAELDYGAKVSQRSEDNLEKLYRLLEIIQVVLPCGMRRLLNGEPISLGLNKFIP